MCFEDGHRMATVLVGKTCGLGGISQDRTCNYNSYERCNPCQIGGYYGELIEFGIRPSQKWPLQKMAVPDHIHATWGSPCAAGMLDNLVSLCWLSEPSDQPLLSPGWLALTRGYAMGTACLAAVYRFLLTPKQQWLDHKIVSGYIVIVNWLGYRFLARWYMHHF